VRAFQAAVPARARRRERPDHAPAPAIVESAGYLERPGGSGLSLEARSVTKAYGGVHALENVDVAIAPGSVHALIGPNGSGKTTLLKVLAGAVEPDAGRVLVGGSPVTAAGTRSRLVLGVARTLQRTQVWPDLTVRDHVIAGMGVRRKHGGALRNLFATPKARAEDAAVRARSEDVLELVGLVDRAGATAAELSSGDQRLLMIAMAYASAPGALLLDEPSAGMSFGHTERLVEVLRRISATGVSMLIVEHNLRLVRYLAARVTVLDAGTVIAEGDVAAIAADPVVREAYLGRATL
jgi:branched-chain amino acid transport system ATP-binding protein